MPIAGNIRIMLTRRSGDPAFLGQPRPWNSYGNILSTTELVCGHNNLFDLRRDSYPIFPIEWNFVDYRSVAVYNDETLGGGPAKVVIWFTETLPGPGTIEMGLDPVGVRHNSQVVAQFIPNRYTPPAGVTFSAPIDQASGLVIPILLPGYVRGLWFRRYVPPDQHPVAFDGASLSVHVSEIA